jgi:hypothetical protein
MRETVNIFYCCSGFHDVVVRMTGVRTLYWMFLVGGLPAPFA